MGQPSPVAQDSPTEQGSPTEQDSPAEQYATAAGHTEPGARSPYAEHTARLTRSLAHALVSTTDDAELAETVRGLAVRLLEAAEDPAAVTVEDPHPRSGFRQDITPITSAVNPLAPPMAIRREGEESVSDVALPLQYQGPPARVHGGIVALMLDQVLGNASHSTGLPASYTRELTITYDAATPLDRPVRAVGRIDRVEGRKRFMSGEILVDGVPSARAHGLWISPREAMAPRPGAQDVD